MLLQNSIIKYYLFGVPNDLTEKNRKKYLKAKKCRLRNNVYW